MRSLSRTVATLAILLAQLGDVPNALTLAVSTLDATYLAEAIVGLAPYLPRPLMSEAFTEARKIRDSIARSQVIACLAVRLAELGQVEDAMDATRGIQYKEFRAEALFRVAHCLPEPARGKTLRDALATAYAIEHKADRSRLLVTIAQNLPEPQRSTALGDALPLALRISLNPTEINLLASLVGDLPEPIRRRAIDDALTTAGRIDDSSVRDKFLARLTLRLAEVGYPSEALVITHSIGNRSDRAKAIASVAPYLSEPSRTQVLVEALKATEMAEDVNARVDILVTVTPHLSGPLLAEVLAAARDLGARSHCCSVLAAVVPRLAETGHLDEALTVVHDIDLAPYRATALTALLPYFPEPERSQVLVDAFSTALQIEHDAARARALTALTAWLVETEPVRLLSLWHEMLRERRARRRQDLVTDLRALGPVLAALGGTEAVRETVQAIKDVGRWWP